MTTPSEYLFVNPVWGEAYVERFLKLSLPAQLSAGNMQAMPRDRSRYLICTHERHFDAIRESAAFRRLEQLVPCSLIALDDLPDPRTNPNPHELQTAAFNRGLRFGRGRNAAFIFLTPDVLLADGAFARLVELCERQGKRAVTIASIRMCIEGAIECLDEHRTPSGDASIPARDLVRHCLNDLHPISEAHIVTERGVKAAQHRYWPVGSDGLLIHAFHLSPILVWPEVDAVAIRSTLDDDYVGRACPDRGGWYTATDTDEICQVEFSERNHKSHIISPFPVGESHLQHFLQACTNETHRELFRTAFRFHASPIDAKMWGPVEAEAAKFVSGLLQRFESAHRPQATAPTAKVTTAGSMVKKLLAPVRFANRLLAAPIYRYVDRLNAEIVGLRNEVAILQAEQLRVKEKLGGTDRKAA